MKIAVCVKEIPDFGRSRRLDPESGRIVREGDQILNPFDSHAIEAALQLKESGEHGDVTVHAICMGPASAQRTLQKALALGADTAVLITDEQLVGSDVFGTANALCAAIKQGEYDLVLMGQQAGDSECWVLPGMLAGMLGWPVVTQASDLKLAGNEATVSRQAEAGYENLSAELPAVIGVSDALNEPRYPSLKAIMGAKKKPLETMDLAALGVTADTVGSAGAKTTVISQGPPPAKESGVVIEDDGTGAEQLVAFLAQKSLV